VDYRKKLIDKKKGLYASLRDEKIFEFPKIYITRTGNPFKAFLDENTYASNNFFSLQFKDYKRNDLQSLKVILPFIVASITQYFIRTFAAPRLGNTFVETKIIHLLKFRIPELDKSTEEELEKLVNEVILTKTKNPSSDTISKEREIDLFIYRLYGLTEEEIAVVEGKSP